ncbi:GDSL esterase/lipase At5g45910-like isoform X3 [Zea mays]|uniref:GDSL esterase/lipase At5g45910-like isoform X3 n=1 Tax=Zea mays TaxID=4577 RepID=UPI0009AA1725|nr:uncharacterized protein LOC100382211 isoform X3 [Zea mays]|eukprot:XP_020397811.1 uncharacterized protein LOC100382211 isoform X3 [Zea mays]
MEPPLVLLLSYLVFYGTGAAAAAAASPPRFNSIFSFGNSYADTGNFVLQCAGLPSVPFNQSPYGETFFRRPTGRASDGRLIIDFIAEALGVPLLPPFLSSRQPPQDMSRGANFAIVGGTALDVGFFLRRNAASVPPFRSSLRVQIGWFRRLKKRLLCNANATAPTRSLFVVGELGSNDYAYILAGASAHAEAGGRGGEIRSGVGDAAGGVPTDGADQVRSGREAAAGGHEREERDGVLRPADGVLAAAQRAGGVPQLDAAGGRRPLAPKVPDHQARLRRLLPAGGAAPPAARQVRVHRGAHPGVLRRRRAIQLQPRGSLWLTWRDRLP